MHASLAGALLLAVDMGLENVALDQGFRRADELSAFLAALVQADVEPSAPAG